MECRMHIYYYRGGVEGRRIISSLNTVLILKGMSKMKSSRAASEVSVCGCKGVMFIFFCSGNDRIRVVFGSRSSIRSGNMGVRCFNGSWMRGHMQMKR